MALPISNLSVNLIYTTLGVSSGRDLFYIGSTLKTVAQLALVVNKNGLNATYCPGANADARLDNLLADRKLSYFKGYEPIGARALYGYLYNGIAYSNAKFAPLGWRVPTQADYAALSAYLGGDSVSGGKLKEAGLVHWDAPNTGADNSSGFTALGAGIRNYFNPSTFEGQRQGIYLGISPERNPLDIFYRKLVTENSLFTESYHYKQYGMSIRLIKTDSVNPSTLTDYDGNIYDCVTIGSQVWTKQNWKCTSFNDGVGIQTITDGYLWANATIPAKCAYDNDESNV